MVILEEEKLPELDINESTKYIKNIFCLDDMLDLNDMRKLKNVFKNLIIIKKEEDLIKTINEKKFEIFIIMLSLKHFPKYIDYLNNNIIYNIPISIIFTKNNNELLAKMDENYKKYINDKFYNYFGLSLSIENLISKIKNFLKYYDNVIEKLNLGETPNPSDYRDCYSYEYINNEKKLIFPYLYNQIMLSSKITFEEIKDTNKYLLEKYGKTVKLKKLVIPLLSIEDIPCNIIAKFWGRIYTLESSFFRNLNNNLMKLANKDYNTYIKVLYKGLKEFEYNGNDVLYRGTNISDKEMDVMINLYNNRKINNNSNEFQPSYLIYSRAYLSFSKNKNKSLGFIKNVPQTKKILFLLQNNSENKILSNANLYNISTYPDEDEILFFPFSSFIIAQIKEKENIYYIDLIYLGIYENKIKESIEIISEESLDEIVTNSNFGNEVFQSGIIAQVIESDIINYTQMEKNFINNIIESNYILNKRKEKEKDQLKNGIICTYNKQEEEINILCDFSKSEEEYLGENLEFYKEAKNNIDEKNIEIYINDIKISFSYKYKSNEIGIIKIKFILKNLLTSTFNMFSGCSSLTFIDLSSLDISKVTNISGMFAGCSSLKNLDFSSFYSINVKYMQKIFCECTSLKSINLSSFNSTNAKNMSAMFKGCSKLEILDLTNFNTSNVNDMSDLFNKCHKLKEIKGINNFDTSHVINMENMFNECKILETIDLSNFDTYNVKTMKNMFNQCNKLKEIKGIENWNTINVTDMSGLFKNCCELVYLNLSNFNTINIFYMKEMFSECYKLKEIKGINNFNTKKVLFMEKMFNECRELENIDVSYFDTSNVFNMGNMFSNCLKIKEIKGINNFNTRKVTNMINMFQNCNELKSLDLSNFNTLNVINMSRMFSDCYKLEFLDLSNFEFSYEADMSYMFFKCYVLKEIKGINKFKNIRTTNIAYIEGMFEECRVLIKKDLIPQFKQGEIIEKIIVNFISVDQNIQCQISCYINEIFSTIEEKLCLKFPELRENETFFLVNGIKINKALTLAENKIKNENTIVIDHINNFKKFE